MRKPRRASWAVIIGSITVAALVIRVGIATSSASRIPQNPLGLNAVDAIVIAIVLATILISSGIWWVNSQSRQLLISMRRMFPNRLVHRVSVVPSTVDLVRAIGTATRLKENTAAVVVLSVFECEWWRGGSRPKQVASIRSQQAIAYRIGTGEHFGRSYAALVATVKVEGTIHKIPLAIISEQRQGIFFKIATGDELATIEAELQPL